ncbi:MAG: shikimate dehydrogenase [Pyrinomonadaceae bacterium]
MNKGKICVSICAATADEFIENIKRAAESADVIELRFDCLPSDVIKSAIENLPKIGKQYLVTFRPKEQGGKRDLTLGERLKFWEFLFWTKKENAFWVDFEFDLSFVVNLEKTLTIASSHDFSGVSESSLISYEVFAITNADVLKIAVQTDDITDSIAVWKLLERAKKDGKQIILIAMGEAGKWTRILGLAHGAFMTYAALDAGKETAGGQITAKDLIETYRVKELDEQTEIYGIVGNPISHSLSPFMHNAAFKAENRNAVFIPFEVKNLCEFIKKFVREKTREVELNFKGFSVTIPHKIEIINYLDSIDETAQVVGAVNTVKITDGKLQGFNTDAHGFVEPLKTVYGNLENISVAVFGSGGAARACIYALKKEKANVTIYARNSEKAKSLAKEFDASFNDFNSRFSNLESFDVVVNATPLGMQGAFENETPIAASQMENVKLVYDLVYNPFETALIKEARKANVPTLGGLAMLVAQGAKQFEIWTGNLAPLKLMSAAALRKLK